MHIKLKNKNNTKIQAINQRILNENGFTDLIFQN
jgi:hypothetical protein